MLEICNRHDCCSASNDCKGAQPHKPGEVMKCFLNPNAKFISTKEDECIRGLTIGYEEDEVCNRDGCEGIISLGEKEGCTCFLGNHPCSACCEPLEECDECGWTALDEFGRV